jgi:protein-L-isoaspartate(D-aspartate) O-methyltransferase
LEAVEGIGDAAALREALVNGLLAEGHITQPRVAEAFRAVPRHLFLPGMDVTEVYQDKAIAIKVADGAWVSSSSQPAMMAIMLEQLELQPGQRVLEVGAGSGFNAALIAHLVGDAALVTTVDIDGDLVEQARANLTAAGFGDVRVICADGWEGYRQHAPYDRMVLTVGAWDISPAWVEQLREGGILLLPLDFGGVQLSMAFEKLAGGLLRSRSAQCCGFMRLRGAYAGPDACIPLDEGGKTLVEVADAERFRLERLRALLSNRPQVDEWSFPGDWQTHFSFRLWLALNETPVIGLQLNEPAFGLGAGQYEGIFEEEPASLCLVGQREEGMKPRYTYGGPGARDRLQAMAAGWQAKGPPDLRALRVTVYPIDATVKPAEGERLLRKRWWQYVVRW